MAYDVARLEIDATGVHARSLTGGADDRDTVLLVDDEPGVRDLIRTVLTHAGYRTLVAGGPAEAVELSKTHPEPIALLLTDIILPGMSGRELAEVLGPQRPQMRLLYVSGYTTQRAYFQGAREGAAAFLAKPFSPAALRSKVCEVLRTDLESESDSADTVSE
jgi:hypothetical protein